MGLNIFKSDKLFKHSDRIAEWQETGDTRPITWEFSLTNRCNNRCPSCYGWQEKTVHNDESQNTIPFEKAIEIVNQLADFGARGIMVTGGGEPTLHPNSMEVLKHIKSVGIDVGLITNGLLLHKIDINAILENATWCRISLDAGTPEMYKRVHGLGEEEYNQVVSNIKLLTDEKKKLNSECTIGVGYLTRKDTLEGMEDYAKISSTLGLDYATYRPFHRDMTPIDEELKKAKKHETETFKVLSSEQKYNFMKNGDFRSYPKCVCHSFIGDIGADARVYLCDHMEGNPNYCLGDLNKNTLKEIWSSEQRKEVIKKLKLEECSPFCRGDSINRTTWGISQPRNHINFV